MELEKTNRGFDILKFKDRYDFDCSLQKSSLASEECIWLGANENRMHLTKKMVRDLLPYLHKFVETGEIDDD